MEGRKMKAVLLYANDDSGLEGRLEAALDTVRLFEGHLICVQVTPFDSFIMGDPFGGVYALPTVVAALQEAEDKHRAKLEAKLRNEGVSWDWLHFDGQPAQMVVERSRLSDLILVTPPTDDADYDGPSGLAADVALHARTPVLAVPRGKLGIDLLGPAMVAWNGSQESCNALRLTMSLLEKAAKVHVVTVAEEGNEFPSTWAAKYLARHGVATELHEWPRGERSIAEALIDAATVLNASYVVMGAYGHSRFRESVLGGVTRDMLRHSPVPLLLAH
jgi:nucleotide-binding universal stress UspA family protein